MATAGVHPEERARPCESKAEERVWLALKKGLPSDYWAWHSLRIRTPDGTLGEGDFVLAHPGRGFLVLEVKGGRIDQRDGRWFQNGEPMKCAPLDQVRRFSRLLARRLELAGRRAPPFGEAVCFPDVETDCMPTQDDLRGAVLCARELGWLHEALPALFDRLLGDRRPEAPFVSVLHGLWGETWRPGVSLGTRAKDHEARVVELDERQREALWAVEDNDRMLVLGGAGSGKTLLAKEVAAKFAAGGAKVLVLCFTKALATWLERELAPQGVEVSTVAALVLRLLREGGVEVEEPGDVAGWDGLCRRCADEHVPLGRWDAIVVDEAQDLTAASWDVVSLLAFDRRLWVFADEQQQFWPDRRIPTDLNLMRFNLKSSHRCPPGILALANGFLGRAGDQSAIRKAIGDGALGAVAAQPGRLVQAIEGEIDRLLGEKLRPADIAVVSVRGQTAEGTVPRLPSIGRHAFVHADDPAMAENLVADSFLRLKGLERPAVIVTDLEQLDPADSSDRGVRLHIAATRAKVALRFVARAETLEADPVLRLLRGAS
jgi:hypothetical protein